jgi:hypothetical protein
MLVMTDREVRVVKGLVMVLALLLVAGCSSFVPMEQLEAEAMLTGDWSAVESRERLIHRRNLRADLQCPPGSIGYCDMDFGRANCTCVETEIIRSLFVDD